MIKLVSLSAVLLFFSTASYAEDALKLSSWIKSVSKQLNSKKFTLDQCDLIGKEYARMSQLSFVQVDQKDLAKNGASISRKSFLARIELRKKLREWEQTQNPVPAKCVNQIRDGLRVLRYLEETVAMITVNPAPYDDQHVAPYLAGAAPYLQLSPGNEKLSFPRDLKSGDLLVSRGNAPTSALIARLGDTDGQFSHLAMVYVHPQTKQAWMMEMHIEVGSAVRTYETYANDHNFRVSVYRHKDEALAARAAEAMYKMTYDPNDAHVVPYDFHMIMDDPHEMFCSEIGYEGFKEASDGRIRLGKYRTQFHPKNRDLLDRLGVRVKDMFAPSDMELEPNFELLAEWRDVSRVANNQMLDAILTKFLEWGEQGYVVQPTLVMQGKAVLGHLLRLLGAKKDTLPTNMSIAAIEVVQALDSTVNALLGVLSKQNDQNKKTTGYYMTFAEMFKSLEAMKTIDSRAADPLFHQWYAPRN